MEFCSVCGAGTIRGVCERCNELSSLRSRNSELVEGIKKLANKCKAKTLTNIMSREVDIWQAMAYGEIAYELESLLPPDPATEKK